MKLIKTRDFLICIAILLVGLIFGIAGDYDISKTLFLGVNNPVVGEVISSYLLLPYTFILFLTGISFTITSRNKLHGWGRWVLVVLVILCVLGGTYVLYSMLGCIEKIYGRTGGIIHNILILLLTLGLSFFIYFKFFYKKIDEYTLFKCTVIMMIIMVVGIGGQMGAKYLWSRPRPNVVMGDKIAYDFKNVWELQPFLCFKLKVQEDLASFPSGHTMNTLIAGMGYLTYLSLFKKTSFVKAQRIIIYCSLLLTLLVGFLRMLAGKHFLTDVVGGAILILLLAYLTFYIGDYVIYKAENKTKQ